MADMKDAEIERLKAQLSRAREENRMLTDELAAERLRASNLARASSRQVGSPAAA